MNLVDYTHPDKVAPLYLQRDRRSAKYYLRLDELPPEHPYHSGSWALFRYPEWLEGGSAWVQAYAIAQDLAALSASLGIAELCPVVGSGDLAFDEALAQGLRTMGYYPKVAENMPRHSTAQS